jgi:hypothetical protein
MIDDKLKLNFKGDNVVIEELKREIVSKDERIAFL